MSAKDIYHDIVKRAMIKDGWTITHDPFTLELGGRSLYVDLGAECLLSAEKGMRQILVEIKSFIGASDMRDLQLAIGQYLMYWRVMQKTQIERELYLAVSEQAFREVFQIEIGQLFLEDQLIRLLVFDDVAEVITAWIPI